MQDFERLKALLDTEHEWPSEYQFKFITLSEHVNDLSQVFENDTIRFKRSKTGRYVGLTVNRRIKSSDEVIDVYKKAAAIEGVIAL